MKFKRLADQELRGKRVFIRADLNVPQDASGSITDDTRIRASVPGIRLALDKGAAVMVTSHLGRPKEGIFDRKDSLAPIAAKLSEYLKLEVPLVSDWLGGVDVRPGQVVLLENCRFNVGEKADDEALARKIAALCDVYVNDAFGTAHRAEATTHGVAKFAPAACAGPLMAAELDALTQALSSPRRPLVAIVAGSKVSTKLTILAALAKKVDRLIVGGGIANTFLAATGVAIGKSLAELDMLDTCRRLLARARERGADIPLPSDVVVASEFAATAHADVRGINDVHAGELILDIGPDTAERFAQLIAQAGTVLWNGPVGVFEFDQFGEGTRAVANAIAASKAFSLAGGGDTLAAIEKYGVAEGISYISTGGGAFLEFVEGKQLPAVVALEERAAG